MFQPHGGQLLQWLAALFSLLFLFVFSFVLHFCQGLLQHVSVRFPSKDTPRLVSLSAFQGVPKLQFFFICTMVTQSAFYVNLYRAVIGPSG